MTKPTAQALRAGDQGALQPSASVPTEQAGKPVVGWSGDEPLRGAMRQACDLLAERTHGNAARSPGHNARLVLEAALSGYSARNSVLLGHCVELTEALEALVDGPPTVGPLTQRGRDAVAKSHALGIVKAVSV